MTSPKQIEANALKSTGPTSDGGKERSRRNAMRHGLTAETVVEPLEDPEEYKAFEISITSEFDAQTAVERELVLRLASVLWRLRRSTAIETALLQIGKPSEGPADPVTATAVSFAELIVDARFTDATGRKARDVIGSEFESAVDCAGDENRQWPAAFCDLPSSTAGRLSV